MEYHSVHDNVIEKTAEKVFAPVMYAYVSWVLEQAEKENIKRLYFLARDGYQMYLTARILCANGAHPVDCRYLKCSRYALRVPAYHLQKEACLDLICQGGIDVTLRKVLKRTGLEDAALEQAAETMNLTYALDQELSYQEVLGLKEKFAENKKLMEMIYEHSRKAYGAAAGYLRQEGLLEGISFAVVDSGWIGTLQQTLQTILRQEGYTGSVKGFYFGLYEIPEGADRSCYQAFYFMPFGQKKRKVFFSNSLFECIFGAPEGMTVAYSEECGRYVPIPEQKENRNRVKIEQTADAVCRYVKELYDEKKIISADGVQKLLEGFMGHPSREEAEEFGKWKFTDDVLESAGQTVAANLNEKEIAKNHFVNKSLIMLGLKKGPVHESAWLEGSIVRCGRHVARHLRQNRLYKYVLYTRKEIMEKKKQK